MDTSQPRISANELGNYVFSNPGEKRRILQNQKVKKPFIAACYQSAHSAILRCFHDGIFSEAVLAEELEALKAKPTETKFQARVRPANITALRRFMRICGKATPPSGEHSIIRRNADFEFEGVKISVRPDILTQNSKGKFFTYSKLRLSQHKYSSDASEIVLLLIQKFAEQQDFEGLNFDVSRARLIDCFSQRVFEAHNVSPYKGKLLMKALKEIHSLWPFILSK
ncbi:MAG TPA: hypothetical protein DCK99_18090 [Blastocatellia bacterium]|nr:hypothetical protein [Blastocatellia bacterium]